MQAPAAKLGLTPLLNKARTGGGAYPALDDRSGKLTRAKSGNLSFCAHQERVLPSAAVWLQIYSLTHLQLPGESRIFLEIEIP